MDEQNPAQARHPSSSDPTAGSATAPAAIAPLEPLPATVKQLGWVSFFADISSSMIYPVVPLFVVGALKIPGIYLGIIEGLGESLVSLMKGLSGWHSDRQRKRVGYLCWGYSLSAIAKPLLALAFHWPMVLLARSSDRFGKGLRTTARDALIADSISPQQTGRAYGLHKGMDAAGAFVGVVLAVLLMGLFPGELRLIFVLAAFPALLSVLLTFKLREPHAQPVEPAVAPAAAPAPVAANAEPPAAPAGFPAAFWFALGVLMIFALANSSDMFLLLRAREVGLSESAVVMAYALYNLTAFLVAYPAGRMGDRRGHWPMIALGWVLYAGVYAGFGVATSTWMWSLFAFYGVYMGLAQGATRAMIAQLAPKERKGSAIGIFHMATGLAALVSNGLAGWIWDGPWGHAAVFWVGAGSALVAAVLIPLAAVAGLGPGQRAA